MAELVDRSSAEPEVIVTSVKKRVVVQRAPVIEIHLESRKDKKRRRQHGRRRFSDTIFYPLGVLEHRVLGGVARSAEEYRRRSDNSAEKRRDGAVRDAVKNVASSSEEFFAQASRIPGDIVESKPFDRAWGQVRRLTRILSW